MDGNTLRRQDPSEQAVRVHETSESTKANRARSLQMNIGYVTFLAVASILSVFVCVRYLRLQARYTSLQKEQTTLESTLSTLKLENDEEYNRIMNSVNLEEIREKAMNELGMVYAGAGQVITYQEPDSDYVKQYTDISD